MGILNNVVLVAVGWTSGGVNVIRGVALGHDQYELALRKHLDAGIAGPITKITSTAVKQVDDRGKASSAGAGVGRMMRYLIWRPRDRLWKSTSRRDGLESGRGRSVISGCSWAEGGNWDEAEGKFGCPERGAKHTMRIAKSTAIMPERKARRILGLGHRAFGGSIGIKPHSAWLAAKRPFLDRAAALKMKESQCPKPARVTHPA